PAIRSVDGVAYYNSGDWVESCSVLLEDQEGNIELLTNLHLQPELPPPLSALESEPELIGSVALHITDGVQLAREV
ncbi:MAG: hypothetical protein QOD99_687, partial [Chthoniobacter sp.]|nr:hypothetical protein [Chthoniobacter sp.]